jgi:ATP-binding cassette subfamily F protein uup
MEGDGRAVVYAGGWSDYRAQRAGQGPGQGRPAARPTTARKSAPEPAREARGAGRSEGLSFTQRHRLEALPTEIERLGAEISRLEALLGDPDLYARDPARFDKATRALAERQARLDAAETEWLELELLRE